MSGSPAPAPRFLTEPIAVITDSVTAVDGALPHEVVEQVVVSVVDTRPKQRRLARALHESPGLLTSEHPAGPRQVGELVEALLEAGGTGFVRSRCAHCHRERPLPCIDAGTELRICGSCSYKTRSRFDHCATCGRYRHINGRDHLGRPSCQRCRTAETAADPLEQIHQYLVALGTGLETGALREIAETTLPRPFQRLRMSQELAIAPTRLLEDPAAGSHRLVLLAEALHERGAVGVPRPVCSVCGRDGRALRFARDERRCCRACFDAPRRQTCTRCGRLDHVAARTLEQLPLCSHCDRTDPINHETCIGCGETRPVVRHDDDGHGWCHRCWRGALATCAVCGLVKPCRAADTDQPRCEQCARKQRPTVPCVVCGKAKHVHSRTADGEPICNTCGHRREPCAHCGHNRRVQVRGHDGPLCRSCWQASPDSFQTCTSCGVEERMHHFGLCVGCAAKIALRDHLGAGGGDIPAAMTPVFHALVTQDPFRLIRWLDHASAARVVADLAAADLPVTHAALDAHLPNSSVQFLRAALVNNGALEPRDENLAVLEHWLDAFYASLTDPTDRKLLRGYAIWHHLRRLRSQPGERSTTTTTTNQLANIKFELNRGRELLDWLRRHGRELATCTQDDIDRYLTEGPATRYGARPVLTWASAHRYAPAEIAIPYQPQTPPQDFIADDERWRHARHLLTDDTIPAVDRLAGLLLLLYAQPASRISLLRLEHITRREDGHTEVRLGDEPIVLRPPLDDIAHQVLAARTGRFRLGHHDQHPWLFPGGTPGRPMSAPHLTRKLKKHGIAPRAARNTALIDLASQIPAAVLGKLLGIDPGTAETWANYASPSNAAYAHEIVQRHS